MRRAKAGELRVCQNSVHSDDLKTKGRVPVECNRHNQTPRVDAPTMSGGH
jgi:hypothetical protein